ncbi:MULTISPECIES: NAD(P)/FAD-dependent oxidoreductase [unclassified Phenylobacterium]|uniref:flavin-containing monooxygenase n=1 Tax=unclassified Phenylobacterium TaxID=2640670 RepID=UPI0009E6FC13|nr:MULTISPECIES: NAD(P)/FAD-dependent oxidoreductase [unclassified Phenylobacterium]
MSSKEVELPHHVDVLILGAGISGIGAAYELTQQCRDRSFAVLEAFESFGGTWLAHRYPGVRSDSDLFTYGFRFKPWHGRPIASRDEILQYLGEAIEENALGSHFHYRCRVISADWQSDKQQWRVEGVRGADQKPFSITCGFLWSCQGYYRHGAGYTPGWPGMEQFEGRIVHPQTWPEDLDFSGKRVVVIGSGATAATLVPALAPECEHVTMLQRSPTYFSPAPNRDALADTLRDLGVEPAIIHDIMRKKIVREQQNMLTHALENPEATKAAMLATVATFLPADQVEAHFTPTYRPWQQRVALVPNGDLFKALRTGQASVVTDHIESFTPTGLRLASGGELDADIIVTATGFEMSALGDTVLKIDGEPLNFADSVSYRSILHSGIPNMARTMGYFRVSSWTLRVHLVSDFVCRLLNHMRAIGAASVEVQLPPESQGEDHKSGMDKDVFNAGYILRGLHLMPKRGPRADWQSLDYVAEESAMPAVRLDGDVFGYRDAAGRLIEGDRRAAGELDPAASPQPIEQPG